MGRKKTMTEAELENTQTTLTIEDANQAEAEEAELLAETEVEEIEEVKEEAPKRQRKPRAKKTEEMTEAVTEAVEAGPIGTEIEEVKEEAPKRQRKPRAKKTEEIIEAVEVAPEASVQTLDQWAAIKQLSEQVSQILEKNSQVKLPPPQLDIETGDFFRPTQPEPKTLFVTKFAVAASIAAVLLSVVSLSLAQSTRQAVLGALQPLKQSGIALRRSQ